MALYAEAKMNFFVSNGPVSLCVFSDAPWMQFVTLGSEEMSKFWVEHAAVEKGEQYPWSKPNQRIIWQPDTYENLVAAWEQFSSPVVPLPYPSPDPAIKVLIENVSAA